ncbi:MAG: hypothetical protein EOM53_04785 [Alphaproteobacteria bacterium]|nr:hypothetical protein [Alphaproteobacteria bacterium]
MKLQKKIYIPLAILGGILVLFFGSVLFLKSSLNSGKMTPFLEKKLSEKLKASVQIKKITLVSFFPLEGKIEGLSLDSKGYHLTFNETKVNFSSLIWIEGLNVPSKIKSEKVLLTYQKKDFLIDRIFIKDLKDFSFEKSDMKAFLKTPFILEAITKKDVPIEIRVETPLIQMASKGKINSLLNPNKITGRWMLSGLGIDISGDSALRYNSETKRVFIESDNPFIQLLNREGYNGFFRGTFSFKSLLEKKDEIKEGFKSFKKSLKKEFKKTLQKKD